MAKQIQVIVIDPHKKTIVFDKMGVELKDIYTKIDASAFDIVHLSPACTMFVDDTGLYRMIQKFFRIKLRNYAKPMIIGGIAVVTGSNSSGDMCDVSPGMLDRLQEAVTWPNLQFMGMRSSQRTEGRVTIFTNEPHFVEVK